MHAQDDSLAGTAMIGWLTRRRRSIGRKWSDVMKKRGIPEESPKQGIKRGAE